VLLAALTAEQLEWWLRDRRRSRRAVVRDLQAVAAALVTG
jgi:hypothetical protein